MKIENENENENKIKKVKRLQRGADVKDYTYYTRRLLTKEDQTGEISGELRGSQKTPNLSTKELHERQNVANNSSRLYNELKEQSIEVQKQEEQDRVRKFKSGYKVNIESTDTNREKQNEEEQIEEEQIEEK
ncbi:MAG: hypothetical protein HFJ60_06425 [Clostridia bacterium]|jgi:hypothetical protein|nr:hypothetical protein [Clostridia bacterium]